MLLMLGSNSDQDNVTCPPPQTGARSALHSHSTDHTPAAGGALCPSDAAHHSSGSLRPLSPHLSHIETIDGGY